MTTTNSQTVAWRWFLFVAVVLCLGLQACSPGTSSESLGEQRALLCGSVTLSLGTPSPVATGAQVPLSASASCGGATAEYKFAYQWPSNPSQVVTIRDWASQNTATWNTTTVPAGNYTVYVFARTVGSVNSETQTSVGNYLVGPVCNVAPLSASPPASPPNPVGTTVSLSASSTCLGGASPEYQFYYIPAGTGNYVQIGSAGSWGGPTTAFSTAGLPSGLYGFHVRVRGTGNQSSNWEGTAYFGNYLLGNVCLNAALATNPASTQVSGSNVTLTASSTCNGGVSPEYHFLYKSSTESTYHDVQAGYGGATAVWNTSGLAGGTYQLELLARGAGNPSVAESYTIKNFTLASQVTLALSGVAQMNIVRTATASQAVKDAAAELKKYLDAITGGNFTIATNGTASTPGILVGSFDTDFPSLGLASQLPTDSNPTYKEGHVVQVGSASQLWLVGKTDIAVGHAVTRFLKELGVRWFFQGRNWTVTPSAPGGTLTYSGQPIADRPVMTTRAMSGLAFSDPRSAGDNVIVQEDSSAWRKHNRLSYGTNNSLNLVYSQAAWSGASDWALITYTNLQTPGWFTPSTDLPPPNNRYGWFASNNPYTTIEIGNSAVRDKFWLWQLNKLIPQAWPDSDSISVEPGDGTGAGALSRSPYDGTDSDQMAVLANDMVTRLSQSTDPKIKDRYVTFLGGYFHILPPTQANLSLTRRVSVGVMPYDKQAFNGYLSTESVLDGWWNKGATVGIWHNLSFPQDLSNIGSHYSQSLDGMSSDYPSDSVALSQDMASFAAHHASNATFETTDNFGLHGLGYYLLANLMWNPTVDVAALRQDFFQKAFGAAAADMQIYFDLLDPKRQPVLFTKDLMARLGDALTSATTHAAGDAAVLTRLNELKSYLHHNALWWQIYRAPHNSASQIALVKALLKFDYQTRFAYMHDQYTDFWALLDAAKTQFCPSPCTDSDWDVMNDGATWRTKAELMTSDIDQNFTADKAYFASPTPTQVTFSNEPVGVSFSGPNQSLGWGDGGRPMDVALYTSGTSTSLSLQINVGQFADPAGPAVAADVTLRNSSGATVDTRTVQPGPLGSSAFQTLTFSGLVNKAGYVASVNGHGSAAYVANDYGTAMAFRLDKLHRAGLPNAINGLFFYVPAGTTSIQYTWNPNQFVYGNDQIAMSIVPHQLYVCDVPAACSVSSATVVPYKGSNDITDYMETITVPVPAGKSGKVWFFKGLIASQLWFYNLPPYVSTSPTSVVVPRDVVTRDNLTPR